LTSALVASLPLEATVVAILAVPVPISLFTAVPKSGHASPLSRSKNGFVR
jgi:hypothetical protein